MPRGLNATQSRLVLTRLRQDRLPVHPLVPLLWRCGWLMAPPDFRLPLTGALLWAVWFTVMMVLASFPVGLSLMIAYGVFALLLVAVADLDQRQLLTRRRGNLATGFGALLIVGAWWRWHGLVQFAIFGGFANLRELLIFVSVQFGVAVILAMLIAWRRRRKRDLPSWPRYVEQALVAEAF